MADLSLRTLADSLGLNKVSDIAQQLNFNWPPPPVLSLRNLLTIVSNRALVLSGGGAKGSFELGALKYIYGHGFRPKIICSTSVGSINGLKLAEGEGGLEGLEQIWLSLRRESQMFGEQAWFIGQADWLKDIVRGFLSDSKHQNPSQAPSFQWMLFMVGLSQRIWLDILPGIAGEKLNDIQNFFGAVQEAGSLFHLQPIEILARKNVRFNQLGSIRLRMATVGLQSGALKFVSEAGRLLEDPTIESDDQDSPPVDIVKGLLGSAAIPGFFEAQFLGDDFYVDGGVREIVPVQAAISMGASQVYAIVAPGPLQFDNHFANMLDIAGRSLDIALDEITTDNTAPFQPWEMPVVAIRPDFEVHGTTKVNPGLIRINIGYGYMRAFDIVSPRASNSDVQQALLTLSNEITLKRLTAFINEELALGDWISFADSFLTNNPNLIAAASFAKRISSVRSVKNELWGLIDCRNRIAATLDSMPPDALDWVFRWEDHEPAPTDLSFLAPNLPDSPWMEIHFRGENPAPIPQAVPQAVARSGGCPQFN
jgi:NTE family protein